MADLAGNLIRRLLRTPPDPAAPFGASQSVRVFHAGPGHFRYGLAKWLARQLGVLAGVLYLLVPPPFLPDPASWFIPGGEEERQVSEEIRKQFDGFLNGEVGRRSFPGGYLLSGVRLEQIWGLFEGLATAAFVIQLPISFRLVRLDHECRWYIITDRSLRIREGLLRVDERTMTFSNVQHLSIQQGPLQRLFKISDLEVRSAGGGESSAGSRDPQSKSKNHHRAYFRGIANATEIRDLILAQIRSSRESASAADRNLPGVRVALNSQPGGEGEDVPAYAKCGLPGHTAALDGSTGKGDALEAARSLLYEARALRQALQ